MTDRNSQRRPIRNGVRLEKEALMRTQYHASYGSLPFFSACALPPRKRSFNPMRLLRSSSPCCPSSAGSAGLSVLLGLLCLGLTAACVLALPQTSRAQTFNSLYHFSATSGYP